MAVLLVGMSVAAVMLTVAMPVWKQMVRREKEAELIFRGQQYVRAIALFQRRSGPGTIPPNLDVLLDQRFLRKKYKDPITGDDFDILSPMQPAPGAPGGGAGGRGQPAVSGGSAALGRGGVARGADGSVAAGVMGVVSKSKDTSIKLYNGRNRYNEWQFVYVPQVQAPGPGAGPGGRGVQGQAPMGIPGIGGGRGGRGQPAGPGSRGSQPSPDGRRGQPPFGFPQDRGDPFPQFPVGPERRR
jgi:type II secretory pathway pseudopilin PulG